MAWAICVAYPWDKAMREPEDWDKWHVWIPRLFCIHIPNNLKL